ncbi:MAG TPA: TatD family hydrolase [Candidatus Rubrimentiphilum sp.]|nr:TatD family hydrolase [Candidatus Rubrimentiphilum sp.]
MLSLLDTHAHLHDKAFDDDRGAAVERMRAAGVATAITVGCDLSDTQRAFATAAQYGLFASAGIHPHEAKDAPADIAAAFEPFLRNSRIAAIGETGLDYYYDHSPRDVQQRVLRAQMAIARTAGLPLIFHHRDAFEDFSAILRDEWQSGMRGVVHCFTGDEAQAKTYVEEFGLYLGIGGIITFKTAQPIRDAVLATGIDRLVLETDCPYLAPIPHRGQRNEPAYVAVTAQKVAEILSLPAQDVAEITTQNAKKLFRAL